MLQRYLQRKEGGFTLIELLVVMIIIGVLAAVAIPIFLNQQRTARDTTLRSDLRNAATVVTSANIDADKLYALFNKPGVNVIGENAVHNLGTPADWNSQVPNVPRITVSDGTLLAVYMYRTASGGWEPHEAGDFCIGGVNSKSHYDYVPGTGSLGAAYYTKYLYYDVKYGGVADIKQLTKTYNAGGNISCTGAVVAYIAAGGTP